MLILGEIAASLSRGGCWGWCWGDYGWAERGKRGGGRTSPNHVWKTATLRALSGGVVS